MIDNRGFGSTYATASTIEKDNRIYSSIYRKQDYQNKTKSFFMGMYILHKKEIILLIIFYCQIIFIYKSDLKAFSIKTIKEQLHFRLFYKGTIHTRTLQTDKDPIEITQVATKCSIHKIQIK